MVLSTQKKVPYFYFKEMILDPKMQNDIIFSIDYGYNYLLREIIVKTNSTIKIDILRVSHNRREEPIYTNLFANNIELSSFDMKKVGTTYKGKIQNELFTFREPIFLRITAKEKNQMDYNIQVVLKGILVNSGVQ